MAELVEAAEKAGHGLAKLATDAAEGDVDNLPAQEFPQALRLGE